MLPPAHVVSIANASVLPNSVARRFAGERHFRDLELEALFGPVPADEYLWRLEAQRRRAPALAFRAVQPEGEADAEGLLVGIQAPPFQQRFVDGYLDLLTFARFLF
jgi:hypothetical protein